MVDFHDCALKAGFLAFMEGKLEDVAYVKRLAYEFYEEDLRCKNNKSETAA